MEEQIRDTLERNVKRHKASVETAQETLEDCGDWISYLPDSLLLHILSLLRMPDVVRTSVLSKRWRYLWPSISCLDFYTPINGITDIVTFIDRSLYHYEGSKVKKLLIYYEYDDNHALQVDSWIRFAIRHNVEELKFDLFHGMVPNNEWFDARYKLPHSLFSFRSVTSLTLAFCDLNLPASVHLSSLKKLTLEFLNITIDMIMHLTSGCPLLEYLCLEGCNRFENLNISITNQKLKLLRIREYIGVSAESEVRICAPSLISLEFSLCLPRVRYDVKSLPSLVTVNFCDLYCYEEVDANERARLLGDLHHVKELMLCRYFIQVLLIWEVQKLDSFPINAKCIQLQTNLSKWELPGIFYVLKNSAKLETLSIMYGVGDHIKLGYEFKDKFEIEKTEYWESKVSDFASLLQNLKTIKFDFQSLRCLTSHKIKFLRFLLKTSKALERMMIYVGKGGKSCCNKYEVLYKLTEELLTLPRASPNAEIYII